MVKRNCILGFVILVLITVCIILLTQRTIGEDKIDPVLWSIICNEPNSLENALEDGANVDLMTQSEMTENGIYTKNPLRLALDNKTNTCFNILIKYGADVNYVDKNNESLLMCAAAKSDYFKVKTLYDAGADVNYTNNKAADAMTYAITAPQAGYGYNSNEAYKIIRLLHKEGLEIHEKDIRSLLIDNYNSLILSLKCVVLLYDDYSKNEMKIIMPSNNSLYDLFCGKSISSDMKFYELALCVACDNEKILKEYCEVGNDINAVRDYRYQESLLMVAAAFNSIKCEQYLLSQGADVNAKSGLYENNSSGMDALDFAQYYNNQQTINLILDYTK